MKKHKVALAIGCVILAVFIGGIVIYFNSNKKKDVPATFSMQTATLEKRTIMNTLSVTGTVESKTSKTVTSTMTDAKVENIYVEVGDIVKKGDVICVFDSSDLEEDLADAQTNLNISKAKTANEMETAKEALENTKTSTQISKSRAADSVQEATTNYSEATEKSDTAYKAYEKAKQKVSDLKKEISEYKTSLKAAKEDLKNLETSLAQALEEGEKSSIQKEIEEKNGEISSFTQKYEAAKTNYESAKKTEEEKKAAYETAKKEADSAKSSYKKATQEQEDTIRNGEESVSNKEDSLENTKLNSINASSNEENQVETLKEQIADCTIVAPVDGVVTSLNVEAGEKFSGGDVVTVQDNESFIVTATIDEYDIADVEKGMSVIIKTDATGEEELEGEITFVSPTPSSTAEAMGSSQSESGYSVEIKLLAGHERLRIGMTAKASIVLEKSQDVFAVPYDAISTNEAGESVIYVLDEERAIPESNEERTIPESNEEGNMKERRKPDEQPVSMQTRAIAVTVGLESDYYTEVSSDELVEGMKVVLSNQSISGSSEKEQDMPNMNMFGNMGGGMNGGGNPGGGGRGQAPGGF